MSQPITVQEAIAQVMNKRDSIHYEIQIWRQRNSQSNPNAMFELRELRRQHAKLDALVQALKLFDPTMEIENPLAQPIG